MSVNPDDEESEWSPFAQPRTWREFRDMVWHTLSIRYPALNDRELGNLSQAVVFGMQRYGLGLKRKAWKCPPDARLDVQTLADIPGHDFLHFACGGCSLEASHKRRVLMERFGTYFPTAAVPYELSKDCSQRRLRGDWACKFNYQGMTEKISRYSIKWRVSDDNWRGRVRIEPRKKR